MKRVTDKEYWMDGNLMAVLDTVCYNIRDDWDYMFIISGNGMVRVGKSVLAQQIGYYIAYTLQTPFGIDNVVFDGEELRNVAKKLPKNSVIIYDEARGELDSKKVMSSVTKRLQDFFAECGMYNHFFIMVLPDFFELPKNIAINRSEALINVFPTKEIKQMKDGRKVNKHVRGYFELFNRKHKKMLYLLGKRRYDDYDAYKRNFWGEFRKYDVIDKALYTAKKLKHVERGEQKHDLYYYRLGALCYALSGEYSQRDIAKLLKDKGVPVSHQTIANLITAYRTSKYAV